MFRFDLDKETFVSLYYPYLSDEVKQAFDGCTPDEMYENIFNYLKWIESQTPKEEVGALVTQHLPNPSTTKEAPTLKHLGDLPQYVPYKKGGEVRRPNRFVRVSHEEFYNFSILQQQMMAVFFSMSEKDLISLDEDFWNYQASQNAKNLQERFDKKQLKLKVITPEEWNPKDRNRYRISKDRLSSDLYQYLVDTLSINDVRWLFEGQELDPNHPKNTRVCRLLWQQYLEKKSKEIGVPLTQALLHQKAVQARREESPKSLGMVSIVTKSYGVTRKHPLDGSRSVTTHVHTEDEYGRVTLTRRTTSPKAYEGIVKRVKYKMNTGVRSRTRDENCYDSVAATKSRNFKWNDINCFLYLNDGNEVVIVAENRSFVIIVGNLYKDEFGWDIRFDEKWDVVSNYKVYLKLKDWLGIDSREKPLTERQQDLQQDFVDQQTMERLRRPSYNYELEKQEKEWKQTLRDIEKKNGVKFSRKW